MSPTVKKAALVALGCLIAGAPAAIPFLAPFAEVLQMLGAFVSGGAVMRSPGDVAPAKVAK
jgi:hypothetical protein